MEQKHNEEQNYLHLQEKQLREYERQYIMLDSQFHIQDLNEFSKSASNVLAPQIEN